MQRDGAPKRCSVAWRKDDQALADTLTKRLLGPNSEDGILRRERLNMRVLNRKLGIYVLAALGVISRPGRGPAQDVPSFPVWVIASVERAGPTDLPVAQTSAELYAARGEYEAFQVVIQAPNGGLTGVNLTASDLTSDASDVIDHSNLTLYREQYVYVDKASADWGGPNSSRGPGWYPDPLIPFTDPQTGNPPVGGTYRAVPFDLTAGTNQPIWIDVFVPRDAVPGQYSGVIDVTGDQGRVSIPVKLTVWNFTLPLKPSMKTLFQYWTSMDQSTMEELLRHKVMPQKVAENDTERYLIDNLGLTATSTGFWSGADRSNCSMKPAPSVAQFVKAAEVHQKDLRLINYTADEIDQCPSLYERIRGWAQNMHEAGIQNLLVMTPVPYLFDDGSGTGIPAVDIWVVLPKMYVAAADRVTEARNQGCDVWSYNTLSQDRYSPKWLIDYDPIGIRLQAGFISQSLSLTGLLYWRIDRWGSDPWTNPNNEGTFSSNNYPGEGVLVYPGGPVGVSGAVASMRLKQIRDGIEDYEFIELLKRLGRGDWALEIAQGIAPDWTNWTRDGNALESSRRQLGNELQRISALAPPTSARTEGKSRAATDGRRGAHVYLW